MTLPWWSKIILKLILSRIPLSYRMFARIGLFRHGAMDNADYAYGVFKRHYSLRNGCGPWTGAEIGPGDSVFSALLAKNNGATKFWLVDSGNFADRSLDRYKEMAVSLEKCGAVKDISASIDKSRDVDNLLENCNANYLTSGVDSLADIPDQSITLLWSHAVLEHIRAARFSDFCNETYRVLMPGGRASHVVDFKDHLSAGLNNLRFSNKLWEKDWFAQNSGFYTNRIRPSAMIKAFEKAGFIVEVIGKTMWDKSPISRDDLAVDFKDIDDSDLLVSGIHLLLKKSN